MEKSGAEQALIGRINTNGDRVRTVLLLISRQRRQRATRRVALRSARSYTRTAAHINALFPFKNIAIYERYTIFIIQKQRNANFL